MAHHEGQLGRMAPSKLRSIPLPASGRAHPVRQHHWGESATLPSPALLLCCPISGAQDRSLLACTIGAECIAIGDRSVCAWLTMLCHVQIMWCAYVSLVFYAKPHQLPVMTDALP